MAYSKITYDDKTNKYAIVDRTQQATAEDFNEIKTIVNKLVDFVNNSSRVGTATVNTGTTAINFSSYFDSDIVSTVKVVVEVHRISDNALIDYYINASDHTGFYITVWDDNVKVDYVALPYK